MLSREKYISKISTKLAWIKAKVEMCSSLNLLDCNTHMEYFLCGLLNIIYGYKLVNLNSVQANYTSIDLGDSGNKLAVQVTSDNTSTKIKATVNKFIDNNYNLQFDRLVILIIGSKKAYTTDFIGSNGFVISRENDIWDFTKIISDISNKQTSELSEIAAFLDSELVNANGYVGIAQRNVIEEMHRITHALCLSKLMAPGLSRAVAEQIMVSDVMSAKYQYIFDEALNGKRYLVGSFGTGKSHAMLVLCQKMLQEYSAGLSDYIPLFAHVREIVSTGSIQRWLNNRSIVSQKYILFIDGLDEIEYAAAKRIIEEERFLAILSPMNLILVGSRPLTYLPNNPYQIEIKRLSEDQQAELINTIVSDETVRFLPRSTPDQLKRSLSRPLFCIIFALLKSEGNLGWATNEIDLLSIFVEKATKDISENSRAVYDDLVVLSVKTVDKDFGDIHISEISFSETIDTILKTGLVNKQGDYLNFPLIIIAQFLAAKALQQKVVDISTIIVSKEKLGRWKYPLSILFSQSTFEESFEYFAAVVQTSPGTASQIIRDGIRTTKAQSLPSAQECGEMIVKCMNVWIDSLGELGHYIAPIKGSSILTLGICVENAGIAYTWFESKSNESVVVFSYKEMMLLHGIIHTRGAAAQATWPWIITFDYLSERLKKKIDDKSLLGTCVQLNKEAFWDSARIMAHKGTLLHAAIPVNIFEHFRDVSGQTLSFRERNIDRTSFFLVLDTYLSSGITHIEPPFPTGDQDYCGHVWSCYSKERYLELTRFVYSSALESYMELTNTVFACFKDSFSIARLAPCRLVGGLEFDPDSDTSGAPVMDWYWYALPNGSDNEIDIDYRTIPRNDHSFIERVYQNIKENRPKMNYKGFIMRSEVLRLNNPTPVTNIVYDWLDNELEDIGWIE